MMDSVFGYGIDEWNKKIYKNEDGSFVQDQMNAKEFWEEFQIESFPMFKDKCYYHIPARWRDDVKIFLKQVQAELKDKVEFQQIKEKWCWLTVYYTFVDEVSNQRMKELINECIDRLIAKGVHPPRQNRGESND
jgi:hypothetical protein